MRGEINFQTVVIVPVVPAALIVFTLWTTRSNRHGGYVGRGEVRGEGEIGGTKTFYKLCTLFAHAPRVIFSAIAVEEFAREFSKNGYPDV